MALRAAWMWGFQESLGSLGKHHRALSRALLSSFSRSRHLQQPRTEEQLSSCNTDLAVTTHLSTHKLFLPLIYTYPTLLVSHFYLKLRDIYFPPSFLFPSPLSNSWMKPQKAEHNVSPRHAANILQNEATSWLRLKPSPHSHSTNQHTPERAAPGFRSLNSPNITSPNLMDFEKPRTSPSLSTFASSQQQSSFLLNARYCHKALEKCLLN